MAALRTAVVVLRALLGSRSSLVLDNLALRQQLVVRKRSVKRPRLRTKDRIFWEWLSRMWSGWKSSIIIIVKPETVIRWHRLGFKLYWRSKSRKKAESVRRKAHRFDSPGMPRPLELPKGCMPRRLHRYDQAE